MSITVTDRAIQEFTERKSGDDNKYIRLYSRTIVFEDSVTIQGNDMDHAEVMGNELKLLMHKYSIEMTHVLLQYMPNILDSISAQLRQELDKQYKCSLQSEDYKNKECS